MSGADRPVHAHTESHVAVLTLAESASGNRLTPKLISSLKSLLEESSRDPDVRIIVLRSGGPAFCLGMDLDGVTEAFSRGETGIDEVRNEILHYEKLLSLIHELPKPVVALVAGEVKAGGMGLVCAADIVLASETASFCLSEVLFGLIPANVLPYLLSLRITSQKARYLIMTAKLLSSEEAREIGIVDEVIDGSRGEKQVRALIKQLLRGAPGALAETKRFLLAAEYEESTATSLRARARETLIRLLHSREFSEAVEAFGEGFTPGWFARYSPNRDLLEGD